MTETGKGERRERREREKEGERKYYFSNYSFLSAI